jgi:hypothetical protein
MTFFLAICWFLFCGHCPKLEIRYLSSMNVDYFFTAELIIPGFYFL